LAELDVVVDEFEVDVLERMLRFANEEDVSTVVDKVSRYVRSSGLWIRDRQHV